MYWPKLPWEAIGHLYTGMDGGSGEMAPTTFPMPPAAWAVDARLLDTLVPSTSTSGPTAARRAAHAGAGLSSSAFLVAGARNRRSNLRMEGAHKAAPAATWSSGSGNGSHGHGLPRDFEEGEGSLRGVGMRSDHTTLVRIKSNKIVILHRRCEVLGGVRKCF